MKKLVAVAAALVLFVLAATASAANDPRVPALQKKVAKLQSQIAFVYAVEHCDWAYQQMFDIGTLNLFADLIGVSHYSGALPTDDGACAAIGRAAPSPPPAFRSLSGKGGTGSAFVSLLAWQAHAVAYNGPKVTKRAAFPGGHLFKSTG